MKNVEGGMKSGACALGAAVALHALGIGSYLAIGSCYAFKSKPVLIETLPDASLPSCGRENDTKVGQRVRESLSDAAPQSCPPESVRVSVMYEVRNGHSSVSDIALLQACPMPPESINLEGLQFPFDCSGQVIVSLNETNTFEPINHTGSQRCPEEIDSQVRGQISNLFGSKALTMTPEGDMPYDSAALSVNYAVRKGTGAVTKLERAEIKVLAPESVDLKSLLLPAVDCLGQSTIQIY